MTSWIIAKQELKLAIRSRWLLAIALLFTLLSVVLLFFSSQPGAEGYTGFTRQTASLLNLTLFLMPLLTLLVGSMLIAGEKEDGQLSLYMTYPLRHHSIIIGKFIGIALALLIVLVTGYGISAFLMQMQGGVQWSTAFLFLGVSALLMLLFLSVAIMIGFLVKGRLQALGIGLLLWAFFVLFYEFIVMGLSLVIPPTAVLPLLTFSVFFNPVELIRVFTIIFLGSGTLFGPSIYDFTIWASSVKGILLFVLTCVLWLIVPLWWTIRMMKKGWRV